MVRSQEPAEIDAIDSRRQPVWHVVGLCILTCFAYVFYWFYKTWRDLQSAAAGKAEGSQDPRAMPAATSSAIAAAGEVEGPQDPRAMPAATSSAIAGAGEVEGPQASQTMPTAGGVTLERFRDISPPLRTLGLILPLINFLFGIILPPALVTGLGLLFSALALFLAVTLIDGIASIHPDSNSFPKRHPHLATALLMTSLVGSMALTRLPDPYWLLSLAGSIPLAVAQYWLNTYWKSVEPEGLLVRHAFSVKELLAIILGSLLLGLIGAGMMIGVH